MTLASILVPSEAMARLWLGLLADQGGRITFNLRRNHSKKIIAVPTIVLNDIPEQIGRTLQCFDVLLPDLKYSVIEGRKTVSIRIAGQMNCLLFLDAVFNDLDRLQESARLMLRFIDSRIAKRHLKNRNYSVKEKVLVKRVRALNMQRTHWSDEWLGKDVGA